MRLWGIFLYVGTIYNVMKLIIENWRNYLKEQQLDYKRDKTAMEALAHELARYREKGVEDVAVGTMLIPQDKKRIPV